MSFICDQKCRCLDALTTANIRISEMGSEWGNVVVSSRSVLFASRCAVAGTHSLRRLSADRRWGRNGSSLRYRCREYAEPRVCYPASQASLVAWDGGYWRIVLPDPIALRERHERENQDATQGCGGAQSVLRWGGDGSGGAVR